MVTKAQVFIQEFVLSFGFLGGIFAWAGVDPDELAVRSLLKAFHPNDPSMVTAWVLILILVTNLTGILGSYTLAGKGGLATVALAWVAGFIMPSGQGGAATMLGGLLLLIAAIGGFIAVYRHNQS